jgi:hypothetical protein
MKKSTPLFIVLFIVIIIAIVYFIKASAPEDVAPATVAAPQAAAVVPAATVSVLSVTKPQTASAAASNDRLINWSTAHYPAGAKVTINLIKQTSTNPVKFSFVRALATDTDNDGQEMFTPKKGETTKDLYVEVVCSGSAKFAAGCSVGGQPIKVF